MSKKGTDKEMFVDFNGVSVGFYTKYIECLGRVSMSRIRLSNVTKSVVIISQSVDEHITVSQLSPRSILKYEVASPHNCNKADSRNFCCVAVHQYFDRLLMSIFEALNGSP